MWHLFSRSASDITRVCARYGDIFIKNDKIMIDNYAENMSLHFSSKGWGTTNQPNSPYNTAFKASGYQNEQASITMASK